MNSVLLEPTDVLFFRDGRPMSGALSGHGAAWPLPNVVNAAFHAALHRAELSDVHTHRRGMGGAYTDSTQRDRKFGSLLTAGPFPVSEFDEWFFPRPVDLQDETLFPAMWPTNFGDFTGSSLPSPLKYAVANRLSPKKQSAAKGWISTAAYRDYLQGESREVAQNEGVDDHDFSDREHAIGIGIDPSTGTTGQGEAAGQFYSANYLRLRPGWRLGVMASALEKSNGDRDARRDLLDELLRSDRHIVIGGEQRTCTALRRNNQQVPLPGGLRGGFTSHQGKWLVKWILLTPAIWPEIPSESREGRAMTAHPGGWLPNWIQPESGAVLLRHRRGSIRRDYSGAKARRVAEFDEPISARLVAASVPKPIVVTGWALGLADPESKGGARSTHLAASAGAIYYFKADSEQDATALADALNWHGSDDELKTIKNRRSTLMGEKGFGLGVCGTWKLLCDVP